MEHLKMHGITAPMSLRDCAFWLSAFVLPSLFPKAKEEHLLAAIENLCIDYQIEELQNEVYLVGRNKTTNKYIVSTVLKINQANPRGQQF